MQGSCSPKNFPVPSWNTVKKLIEALQGVDSTGDETDEQGFPLVIAAILASILTPAMAVGAGAIGIYSALLFGQQMRHTLALPYDGTDDATDRCDDCGMNMFAVVIAEGLQGGLEHLDSLDDVSAVVQQGLCNFFADEFLDCVDADYRFLDGRGLNFCNI
ncbi:hypothetical protein MRX96_030328 [Rhipicephalus microplus]